MGKHGGQRSPCTRPGGADKMASCCRFGSSAPAQGKRRTFCNVGSIPRPRLCVSSRMWARQTAPRAKLWWRQGLAAAHATGRGHWRQPRCAVRRRQGHQCSCQPRGSSGRRVLPRSRIAQRRAPVAALGRQACPWWRRQFGTRRLPFNSRVLSHRNWGASARPVAPESTACCPPPEQHLFVRSVPQAGRIRGSTRLLSVGVRPCSCLGFAPLDSTRFCKLLLQKC